MTTLYSSVIKLTNLHPATLLGDGGQHAHGALHAIIAKVDPALATRLHDIKGRKPFTLSPLMGLPKILHHEGRPSTSASTSSARRLRAGSKHEGKFKGEAYLREGWQCWLRVTILDDALFKTFIDYFMNVNGRKLPEIRLG